MAPREERQGLTAIDGAIALIAILLIVQMWLLTATLDVFLAGHNEGPFSAAFASGAIFLACLALYLFIDHVDADMRRP